MGIWLDIEFEGDSPDLTEHRLSLSRLGPALLLLLRALRRTASGIVQDALDTPQQGRRRRKYAREAKLIDLQIRGLEAGSLRMACTVEVVPEAGGPTSLFTELPATAMKRVLDDLDAERRGDLRNSGVREFLKKLPQDIKFQRYRLSVDGSEIHRVEFGEAHIANVPERLPTTRRLVGTITGIGFPPGSSYVRIQSTDGRQTECSMPDGSEFAERALALRHNPVEAAVLMRGKAARLVWIRAFREDQRPPSPEQRTAHIHGRWSEALKRLAE